MTEFDTSRLTPMHLSPYLRRIIYFLPALSVLFFMVQVNYSYLPFSWPDEVLFSSPAEDLSQNGTMRTPVLEGIIPGMDRATLWNGPLYMVLLSGVYSFTGESLRSGRDFSFLLAILVLIFYQRLLNGVLRNHYLSYSILSVFAFDLTFIRAANTIRMDILNLLLFIITIDLLHRDFLARTELKPAENGKNEPMKIRRILLAGFTTGLAGITHPFAIILIPIWFIYIFPGWKRIPFLIAGTLAGFTPWLIYIYKYFDIFIIQFSTQMDRKGGFFALLLKKGISAPFITFAGQYGEFKIVMLLILLSYATVMILGLLQLYRERRNFVSSPFVRVYFSSMILLAFVFYTAEAWYPLFAGPMVLLTAGMLFLKHLDKRRDINPTLLTYPFYQMAFVFILSSLTFLAYHRIYWKTHSAVQMYQGEILRKTASCKSIYIRIRPDPYFFLRRERPDMRIYEFIPGQLDFDDNADRTTLKTYDTIQCFLIDENHSWEPLLTSYLRNHASRYDIKKVTANSPIQSTALWIRNDNEKPEIAPENAGAGGRP